MNMKPVDFSHHPDWQRWYFEVRSATSGYNLCACGYVMALNKKQAWAKAYHWQSDKKLSMGFNGVEQPLKWNEITIIVHPDRWGKILGTEEPSI